MIRVLVCHDERQARAGRLDQPPRVVLVQDRRARHRVTPPRQRLADVRNLEGDVVELHASDDTRYPAGVDR